MSQLKNLPTDTNVFMANGKKYFIEDKLSYNRWLLYQKLEIELTFDISFSGMFNKLTETYALLNQQRFADASVCVRDLMFGIANNIDKRTHPAYALCALFINQEDEDRTDISETIIKAKIEDWNTEGYSVQSFFSIALNIVPNFAKVLQSDIQDISAQMQAQMKMRNTKTANQESTKSKSIARNSSTQSQRVRR